MMKTLRNLKKNSKGATAIEYGLLAGLIAVAAMGAIGAVGGSVSQTLDGVSKSLDNGTKTAGEKPA